MVLNALRFENKTYKDCQYQKKILKFLMHLPERTADPTIYILSGELPIEADLDKKYLTQLMNILRSNGIEKQLAIRQLAIKDNNSKSWFIYVAKILKKYDLPSIYVAMEKPMSKIQWKAKLKKSVNTLWEKKDNGRKQYKNQSEIPVC